MELKSFVFAKEGGDHIRITEKSRRVSTSFSLHLLSAPWLARMVED